MQREPQFVGGQFAEVCRAGEFHRGINCPDLCALAYRLERECTHAVDKALAEFSFS